MTSDPYYVLDKRRKIALPGNQDNTIQFAAELWLEIAHKAISNHDFFAVALSGGSTPKRIYQKLRHLDYTLDWSKVYLFWSDERSVAPTDPDSNYRMAMVEGGLSQLPIPPHHIFRMVAEESIEENALLYEETILDKLGSHPLDLVMLGIGEDGHTASLFPHTEALESTRRLVVPNFVPAQNTWRMTFTYEAINSSLYTCLYAVGSAKASIVRETLLGPWQPEAYPVQRVGTEHNPALWILDVSAAQQLVLDLKPES